MENNTRLHRRSSSANDVNHYRLPFVQRLSSFRRRKIKDKDDLVSTELILKISIIKACHLNQNDQVSTISLTTLKSFPPYFIIRPMCQIHM
jgi:phosphatidylserine decarboxylase